MPASPLVAFIHSPHTSCPLVKMFRRAWEEAQDRSIREREGVQTPDEHNGSDPLSRIYQLLPGGLAGRILSVNVDYVSRTREVWIRVSGAPAYLETFEHVMRTEGGVAYQKVFGNKFNIIYRIVFSLEKCPNDPAFVCLHLRTPPGIMIKSSIIHPKGILYEVIAAKPKILNDLKRMGFKVILAHEINGYDYMLTYKQELILIYAYLAGYYRFPRSISLKALAGELGLSVSTLAELLRKAESKVIEAFIRHEMPHYLVSMLLNRSEYKERLAKLVPAARST